MKQIRWFLSTVVLLALVLAAFAPVAAQDTFTVTAAQDAVIRGGPSTTAPRLGAILANVRLTALGRTADSSWVQVDYFGQPGWMAAFLVTSSGDIASLPVTEGQPAPVAEAPAEGEAAPAPGGVTAVGTTNLNVRAEPSTNARTLGTLRAGTTISPDGRFGSGRNLWLRFNFEGQPAWVAGWLVRVTGDANSLADVSAAQNRAQAVQQLQTSLDQARGPWAEIAAVWRGLDAGETQYCSVNPTLPNTLSIDPALLAANPDVGDALNVLNNGINEARRAINEWRIECSFDREYVPEEGLQSGLVATNNAENAFNDVQNRINGWR